MDPSLIEYELSYDKKRVEKFDWRSLRNGQAGRLGYYIAFEWLGKKTANFLHEFYNSHWPSMPAPDFCRLPLDRSSLRFDIHSSLPASTIAKLLKCLVLDTSTPNFGHYTFIKCLKIGHKHFPGKQIVRGLPFPNEKLNG
jgi:hypothetical protein